MTETSKIFRTNDLCELLSISRATLHRFRRQGEFPEPVQLGPNMVGWLASDVDAWVEARRLATPARK